MSMRLKLRREAALSKNRHGPARPGHLTRHGATTGGADTPGHEGKRGISVFHRSLNLMPIGGKPYPP